MKKSKSKAAWTRAFPKQHKKLRPAKAKREKKSRKRLRSISSRMAENFKEYVVEQSRWRAEKPRFCIVTGSIVTDVHHVFGRIGELLCMSRLWLPVSRGVHSWIHGNPKLASKCGLACPPGLYNSVPTEAQIKEWEYRVAMFVAAMTAGIVVQRPKLLATTVCLDVENDIAEIQQTKFWQTI